MHYEGDEIEGRFKKIVQSRPPLRWFANISGSLATYHIARAFDAQDMGNASLSSLHARLGNFFLKPYNKYGTMYKYKPKVQD